MTRVKKKKLNTIKLNMVYVKIDQVLNFVFKKHIKKLKKTKKIGFRISISNRQTYSELY